MNPHPSFSRSIPGAAIACAAIVCAAPAFGQYSVTILHHNDAESKLINLGNGAAAEYGGIARFGTLLEETRSFYRGLNHGVVTLSAGDSYLAGAIFQASLDSGAPGSRTFYDALGMSLLRYDAVTIGNHEFDFGPNVLAEFIGDAQTTHRTQFITANLNFSGEPALQARADSGLIAPSTIVNVSTAAGPKKVGVIGVTTDTLPFVSSPGAVTVSNVADAVNSQIAALKAAGTHVIVLSGHLQGLGNDQQLVQLLDPGVNLIIAGGGDELLANRSNPSPLTTYNDNNAPGSVTDTGFIPISGYNSTASPNLPVYPVFSTNQDKGGNTIPIVTSRDNYSYLGRITLNVAENGTISVDPSSNPQRVASTTIDPTHGVAADPTLQSQVVDPVQSFISGLAQQIIGNTSVQLNRSDVRFRETNLGNFVADAFLTKAQQLAPSFGTDVPQVSLVNGGGIRERIDAGNISKLDTFNVSPFGNILTVVKDVTASDFKLILENAYSKVSDSPAAGITPTGADGRFAQISGFRVIYDLFGQPMVLNTDGTVITPGSRILDVTLDDGTPVVLQGIAVPGLTLDIATLGFLATGGDQYFDADYLSKSYATSYTLLGVTDQNALQDYITGFSGANIGADQRYDATQDGRVTPVPEPGSVALLGGGLLALSARRRRTRS